MENEMTAMKEAKKPAAAAEPQEAGRFMYVGPNRLRDGLQQYQVFKGMPTERIQSAKKKNELLSHIERLFVDVRMADKAIAATRTKGTPLHLAYQEALEA